VAAGVFVLIFGLSIALYPPEASGGWRFWMLMHNFIGVRGYDDTGGVAPVMIFIANILGVVFFSGLLISFFRQRVDKVNNGEVYYNFTGHIVIIGFDPMVPGLVRQLTAKYNKSDCLLQTAGNVPEIRRRLSLEPSGEFPAQVTIVSGSRTSAEDIKKLNAGKCVRLFLFGRGR